jgi:hypothetical protein
MYDRKSPRATIRVLLSISPQQSGSTIVIERINPRLKCICRKSPLAKNPPSLVYYFTGIIFYFHGPIRISYLSTYLTAHPPFSTTVKIPSIYGSITSTVESLRSITLIFFFLPWIFSTADYHRFTVEKSIYELGFYHYSTIIAANKFIRQYTRKLCCAHNCIELKFAKVPIHTRYIDLCPHCHLRLNFPSPFSLHFHVPITMPRLL